MKKTATEATILVVDSEQVARSLQQMLKFAFWGVKVDVATSLRAAEEAVKRTEYTLILSDLDLGDGTVAGLLARFDRRGETLPPVIVFTACDARARPEVYQALSARSIRRIILKGTVGAKELIQAIAAELPRGVRERSLLPAFASR